jgi:replicative DNA helicase
MLEKIPPQAIDIEKAVIGAIIIDSNAIYDVVDVLKPESFYAPANQLIYSAILDLYHKNNPIDLLTVTEQLRKAGKLEEAGGAVYVTGVTSDVVSTRHLRAHAAIVADKAIKRELIAINTELHDACYEDEEDADDILNTLESKLLSISITGKSKGPSTINIGLKKAVVDIEGYKKGTLAGIRSGFYRLDKLTGGWQKSDLIIIGGRPSQGKSLLAIKHIMECGVPSLFFSIEMNQTAISTRMICMESGLGSDDIRRGLTDDELGLVDRAISKLEKLPILIDDTPAIHITELIAKARRAKLKHNIGLVAVDYIQRVTADRKYRGDSRASEVGIITGALKSLAKEIDVPVIALSQLNRSIERGGTRKPMLSDLKESGDIEQDADLVIFVHRPSYYGDDSVPEDSIILDVAKHRNGRLGEIMIKKTNNFSNLLDY